MIAGDTLVNPALAQERSCGRGWAMARIRGTVSFDPSASPPPPPPPPPPKHHHHHHHHNPPPPPPPPTPHLLLRSEANADALRYHTASMSGGRHCKTRSRAYSARRSGAWTRTIRPPQRAPFPQQGTCHGCSSPRRRRAPRRTVCATRRSPPSACAQRTSRRS